MENSHAATTTKVPFLRSHLKKSLLGIIILLLLTLNYLPQTQKVTHNYLDASLERAVTSFAIAKGLNALISVAQGTEIAATPAGMGVNFAIGELLDPVNDMVERFSWVMLASTVSLGIQKVIVSIVGTPLMQALFSLLAFLFFYALIRGHRFMATQTLRLFLFFLILRFSMPLIALGNEMIYQNFLAADYRQSVAQLQETQNSVETIQQQENRDEKLSLWAKIKRAYESTASALNIKKQLADLKTTLEASFNHLLSLITIFTIQTILFPLLFLYLFIKLLRLSLLPKSHAHAFLERFNDTLTSKIKGNHDT